MLIIKVKGYEQDYSPIDTNTANPSTVMENPRLEWHAHAAC